MIDSFLLAHGRKILGIDKHSKEMIERIGFDEFLEASGIETEGTQSVGERS